MLSPPPPLPPPLPPLAGMLLLLPLRAEWQVPAAAREAAVRRGPQLTEQVLRL